MKRFVLTILLVVGSAHAAETEERRLPVTVTPTHFEFLGERYADVRMLELAIRANPDVKLSLMINEDLGCVDKERLSQVANLLKARDPSSVTFIGRTSTDACNR